MRTLPKDYAERVYAGWLGKCIGVRLGAPVESWTYRDIERHLGEVTDFLPLPPGTFFKPDDDTAFPMIMIRALEEYGPGVTAAQMGETLLNYIADRRGTIWWGGYGISSEHTALQNLMGGIPAPRSGSAALNGKALAEQIGGQIFSDIWGLVAPCDTALAAWYAERASSVTHDGVGIHGGRFIAAMVSAAFETAHPVRLVERGLTCVPADSEYARVVRAMLDFYRGGPANWRAAYTYLAAHFGYDKYPGLVHIIPNAGVVALALLYGGGDFSRAVQIATMAGWDTDCNAGNVGAVMGVAVGLAGIDMRWREPMNDFLVAASVIGTRNLLDLPASADLLARLGAWVADPERGLAAAPSPRYRFQYPGATHGFLARAQAGEVVALRYATGSDAGEPAGFKVAVRGLRKKSEFEIYVPTYLRPAELSANGYGASFSPQVYPGQTLAAQVFVPSDAHDGLLAAPYAWDDNHHSYLQPVGTPLRPGQTQRIEYCVPYAEDALLTRSGVVVRNQGEPWSGHLILSSFGISGPAHYRTTFALERPEMGAISGWTFHRGYWRLENGAYHGSSEGMAESYTGDMNWRDVTLEADMVPVDGDSHWINIRVQGARRSYAFGLGTAGAELWKKVAGELALVASAMFLWQRGQRYHLAVEARGGEITASINGQPVLQWTDRDAPYLSGQVGFSNRNSHTRYESLSVVTS